MLMTLMLAKVLGWYFSLFSTIMVGRKSFLT
jgi:hypothetical protein